MRAVTQHEGIMLEIEYDPEPTLGMGSPPIGPLIHSARTLDENYRATGPNLVPMLKKMFFLVDAANGTPFLSMVADELA